ncbi:hypothetical protein C4D60_Mb10t13400 [Musa balbisiana]|uniref:NPH3 domain-containing protein n=1 Tax=Musa balbisiana TaxID=52838 RepID=A0A4S8IWX4_MUSBA|nr:hypothetical protein C4D60_Mb10t13400 [Musa balbisiana]
MKFMKLGNRPDTFFTTEAIRSVSSEVSTDLQIQVHNSLYQLHKFPLLSKCLRLQKLCSALKDSSDHTVILLPDLPGGAEAFEACAKFCYGITITLSSLNIVPVRCAAEYLQMSDDADRGNLVGKLELFFKSCILRRWKDTLVTLQSTRNYSSLCEELGITGRCIDAIATAIIASPTQVITSSHSRKATPKNWWAGDISELGIDHYWRVMVAVKSAGIVPNKLIGEALRIYARRWLPNMSRNGQQNELEADDSFPESPIEAAVKHRLLMEKIVSLLPTEKGSVSCSFLLKLLKAANILHASTSSKMELARRIGLQLEEASVDGLLIPLDSNSSGTLYDVDIVMAMLEEFLLQGQSPATSPPREKLRCERRRSRSSENVHPELDKNARKQLCRILDCKKLSVEACMHAAQNELLPLRVVVQVLFFEQSRAAMSGGQVTELPSNIKALLAKTTAGGEDRDALKLHHIGTATPLEDGWNISRMKCPATKLATLKTKLAEEEDNDMDDDLIPRDALMRSASSRFKALCSLPKKPKRIIRKLLAMNRSASERN